jgi:hypothetical protein
MLEQKQTKKRRLECRCCGQMYWDCTPSKILEHLGFQSTRETAAKFKACKRIDKDGHKASKLQHSAYMPQSSRRGLP